MNKSVKILIAICLFSAFGMAMAWVVGLGAKSFGSVSVLLILGLWAYALNWLAFIPAALFKTEKFYDLTGSVTYLSAIGIAVFLASPLDLRAQIVAGLVAIWALRLGLFLFQRVLRDKGDHRFDDIKINPLRFFLTWTLQACWVVLTAICAFVIITTDTPRAWDNFATIGLVLWVIGFAIEVTADHQKTRFKKDPQNKGKYITSGLWSRSQHPNYFGEMTLWTGIAIMALPILSGWQWLALISPVFVILLISKVSGIPLLQKSGMERWGDDPNYLTYRNQTPVLIPKLFGHKKTERMSASRPAE